MSLCRCGLFLLLFCAIPVADVMAQQLEPDQPPDTTSYGRRKIAEDAAPGGKPAVGPPQYGTPTFPNVFVRDVVVSNTDPGLASADRFGDQEPSIAINPQDPSQIVITAFSGFTWTNPGQPAGNAPLWYSADAGNTWTKAWSIPSPTQVDGKFCPCDQTIDYGHQNALFGTFLTVDPLNAYTGDTDNPASADSWQWPLDKTGQAMITSFAAPNNVDQPWLIAGRDPNVELQDNVYVAYDDFSGCCSPDMHVSVARGTIPPIFTTDNHTGVSSPWVNPGHRLTVDRRAGTVYELYQVRLAFGADGVSQNINWMLNRSTDGGSTWGLNGYPNGIVVANADSTQPRPKFGTVNALLGGVNHLAVHPTTGDVFVVHGNRDAKTGNNRLTIVRLVDDHSGGLVVANRSFVTGQVQAALPSIAINDSGVIGILYDTFDGFSASGYPMFSAHLAISRNLGGSFTDQVLETFLSPATDNGNGRQRVLGDYQMLKSVGDVFYGVFTGNGVPFGRSYSNNDPIFLKTVVR